MLQINKYLVVLSLLILNVQAIDHRLLTRWPSVSDITKPVKGYIDDIPKKIIDPIKNFMNDEFGGPIKDLKTFGSSVKNILIDQYKCWDDNIDNLGEFENELSQNVTFQYSFFKSAYMVAKNIIPNQKILDGILNTMRFVEDFIFQCYPGSLVSELMQIITKLLKIDELLLKLDQEWKNMEIDLRINKAINIRKPTYSLIETGLPSIPTKCLTGFQYDNQLSGADIYLNAIDYLNNNFGWFAIGRVFIKTHQYMFKILKFLISISMRLVTLPFIILDKGLNKILGRVWRNFKLKLKPSTPSSPKLVNFKMSASKWIKSLNADGKMIQFMQVIYKWIAHLFEYAMIDSNACVLSLQSRWQYCQMKENQDTCLKNKVIEFI